MSKRALGCTPSQSRFLLWLYYLVEPMEEAVRRVPVPAQFKNGRMIRYPDHNLGSFLCTGRSLIGRKLVAHDMGRSSIGLFPWHLTTSGRVVASLLERFIDE